MVAHVILGSPSECVAFLRAQVTVFGQFWSTYPAPNAIHIVLLMGYTMKKALKRELLGAVVQRRLGGPGECVVTNKKVNVGADCNTFYRC